MISETDNQSEIDQNVKLTASSMKSLKSETSTVANQEVNSASVAGKPSEKSARSKNEDKKVQKTSEKSMCRIQGDCSSICSFDSMVDLTGIYYVTMNSLVELENKSLLTTTHVTVNVRIKLKKKLMFRFTLDEGRPGENSKKSRTDLSKTKVTEQSKLIRRCQLIVSRTHKSSGTIHLKKG